MKNKIFVFFFATALIIGFYNLPSHASVGALSEYNYVVIIYDKSASQYRVLIANSMTGSQYSGGDYFLTVTGYSSVYTSSSNLGSCENFVTSYWNQGYAYANITNSTAYYTYTYLHVYKGNISGTLKPDAILPEPPHEPTWWETLWSDFCDFVDEFLPDLAVPGNPASLVHLAEWLQDSFTVKVGEGEDDLAMQIIVSPLPTPTPTPTPIPYQTVMTPDGNGGFTINYIYNNPSGTPIITSSPPQQNVNIDVDNNFEYPYYENPENKDNPFEFKIPWYLKLVLKNNDIDIDTLDNTYQSAQGLVQNEDVIDAVDEVYNGFQILPSSWILLIGAIASLPLFAALIHRFLGG